MLILVLCFLFFVFEQMGRACLKFGGKLQTLPPSIISDILRVGGRTVMSGVPNMDGIDFG